MKRKFLYFLILLPIAAASINAQQGGYVGPGADVITVAEARTLRDDMPVILRGRILQFLGNERYLFEDETGSIIIEIESRLWRNITVDENDLVEISGEIDRGFRQIEVEVDTIRKL